MSAMCSLTSCRCSAVSGPVAATTPSPDPPASSSAATQGTATCRCCATSSSSSGDLNSKTPSATLTFQYHKSVDSSFIPSNVAAKSGNSVANRRIEIGNGRCGRQIFRLQGAACVVVKNTRGRDFDIALGSWLLALAAWLWQLHCRETLGILDANNLNSISGCRDVRISNSTDAEQQRHCTKWTASRNLRFRCLRPCPVTRCGLRGARLTCRVRLGLSTPASGRVQRLQRSSCLPACCGTCRRSA